MKGRNDSLKNIQRMDTHAHSEYSNLRLIDAINKIPDMMQVAYQLEYSGITLTDHETVSGYIEWLQTEKKLKDKGIIPKEFKCALGNEIYLVEDRNNIEKYWHYILIAKNDEGCRAIRELSSKAWYHSFSSNGMTRVPTEMRELEEIVAKYPNSLIATNACIGSFVGGRVLALIKAEAAENEEEIYNYKKDIDDFIKWNLNLFGNDFYFELAAGTSKAQIAFNKRVKSIYQAYGLKPIIGSDAHYLTSEYRAAHKGYLNSKESRDREVDEFYWDAHYMTADEAYNNLAEAGYTEEDYYDMCNNSMEIYDKIGEYHLEHKPIIPEVKVPDYASRRPPNDFKEKYPILSKLFESDNIQERYWVNQCLEKLKERNLFNEQYTERLEIEADVISTISEKLEDCLFKYFNTFQHYINLFWECGSIVGPGRGSAVCFLSNYLLGITQLDPIEWELPYWRFLNKERVELPDIDVDLAPSKRAEVFRRIREERGELNVLQVCTFGTEGTRSAIAAAGRGYRSESYPNGLDVEITQYLSNLIPVERGFLWSIDEVINGNAEKDRKPVQSFIDEVNKYPGLLELIQSIEGLKCRRGIHASGVILYNDSPFNTNAIMRSPDGSLTTQWDLHQSEWAGDVKYDYLVTEICDKLTVCIDLLQREGMLDPNMSLREIYDKYLHPSVLNLEDTKLWDALAAGTVLDVFQFSTGVGLATAKQVKPRNPIELTSANALMRLMGEKGKERPLDRYCRLKNDMSQWYDEVKKVGLSEEEIKILEPYYLPAYGVPALQEDLMLVCLDPKLAHFTLKEANQARKIVAKKHMAEIPTLHEKFVNQCPNARLGEYVWETTMGPQMGYAFAKPHSLAYSFVGIQTLYLATNFPQIFWNCACLIVNAGGTDLIDAEQIDEDEIDEKKRVKGVRYGKIARAIGESQAKGIKIAPPDINESGLIFKPDFYNNQILYGLKGITRIGQDLVYEIVNNRPYKSIEDFCSKVKVNKLQMTSLIKAGTFDNLYNTREEAMESYLRSVADQKKRITLQNMAMLIEKDLIPEEFSFEKALYNFNKYLKKFKDKTNFKLDYIALEFYQEHFNMDLLEDILIDGENSSAVINQKTWDNIYQKYIDPIRDWMKANQKEILDNLNNILYKETYDKYAAGSLSSWEMEALSFYYHDHELANLNNRKYGISNFTYLNEEPIVERQFITKDGSEIKMFEINRIAGTVIDKDKNKSEVILLTTDGVVTVKVWKNQYAKWDKQISERGEDGKKHVVEKSFFQKGNKLIITGIRRGDNFIPKKYKNTEYPLFTKIVELSEDGATIVEMATERAEVEE